MDNTVYWIWLSLSVVPGSNLAGKLIGAFGSPEAIYEAERNDFLSLPFSVGDGMGMLCSKDLTAAEKTWEYCLKYGIGIAPMGSAYYPARLGNISTRPAVLYYAGGAIDFDDTVFVSIVGTRRCTEYGASAARKIASETVSKGAVIVSGMAKGIDRSAMEAALASGGKTVAVLGSGVDVVYPSECRELYDRICRGGGIVFSEFAPGSPPSGWHFPIRNRIISALSDAVVVVEASSRSGALITAEYAMRQNKPLLAVPGRITDEQSRGPNRLLEIGASACVAGEDVFAAIKRSKTTLYAPIKPSSQQKAQEAQPSPPRSSEAPRGFTPPGFAEGGSDVRIVLRTSGPSRAPEYGDAKKLDAKLETFASAERSKPSTLQNAGELLGLGENERKLYLYLTSDRIAGESVYIDDIDCGLEAKDLLSAVTVLEINGLLEQAGIGKVRAI